MYVMSNVNLSLKITRDKHVTLVLTEEEYRKLRQLAANKGLSQSGWIRMQIHDSASKIKA